MVVTDSTASLPPEVALERGIVVVPLQVVIGATVYDEGADGATPELVAQALKDFRPVSTSRPAPAALLEVYEKAVSDGADQVLSIHLSGDMSGTHESALLAARDASVPVTVVDSRQVGVATGYAALSASDVLDDGGSVVEAAGTWGHAPDGRSASIIASSPGRKAFMALSLRSEGTACKEMPKDGGGHAQFPDGLLAESITNTSTGTLRDSSLSPSCSCKAVKTDGPDEFTSVGSQESVKLNRPSRRVKSTTGTFSASESL